MACPNCGSLEYRLITPNYVECTGFDKRRLARCGHRYQTGGPSVNSEAICACGNFAIGKCMDPDCGRWVCGDSECSVKYEGKRLCTEHALKWRKADDAIRESVNREHVRRTELSTEQFLKLAKEAGNPGMTLFYEDVRHGDVPRSLRKRDGQFSTPLHHGWKIQRWDTYGTPGSPYLDLILLSSGEYRACRNVNSIRPVLLPSKVQWPTYGDARESGVLKGPGGLGLNLKQKAIELGLDGHL